MTVMLERTSCAVAVIVAVPCPVAVIVAVRPLLTTVATFASLVVHVMAEVLSTTLLEPSFCVTVAFNVTVADGPPSVRVTVAGVRSTL